VDEFLVVMLVGNQRVQYQIQPQRQDGQCFEGTGFFFEKNDNFVNDVFVPLLFFVMGQPVFTELLFRQVPMIQIFVCPLGHCGFSGLVQFFAFPLGELRQFYF